METIKQRNKKKEMIMAYIKDIELLAEMVWKTSALAEDLMNYNSRLLTPFEKAEMDLNKIYNDLMDYKADLLIEDE